MPSVKDKINLFDALFGLIFQPFQITEALYSKPRPPHAFSIFFVLAATVFVPIITQNFFFDSYFYTHNILLGIAMVFFFTFLIFVLFEAIFLRILGVDIAPGHMIAAVSYSVTPFILLMWIVYAINYYIHGSLTIVTIVLTGHGDISKSMLNHLPLAIVVTKIASFLVFSCCLRAVGRMTLTTGMVVTLMSLIPLYFSMLISFSLTESTLPGTVNAFLKLFPWIKSLV